MRIRSRSYGLRAGVGAAMHYQARTRLLLVNTAEKVLRRHIVRASCRVCIFPSQTTPTPV
jgi:hypothetical protein